MPLYTFVCTADHATEVLLKHSELRDHVEPCAKCGKDAHWRGAELTQERDFAKGKYRMKAIMGDGSKKRVESASSDRKRSDS